MKPDKRALTIQIYNPCVNQTNKIFCQDTTWSMWRRSWEKMPLDVGFLHLFLRLRNQDLGIPLLKALFSVFMFLSSTNFCSIQYRLRIIILIIFQVLRFSSFAHLWTNWTNYISPSAACWTCWTCHWHMHGACHWHHSSCSTQLFTCHNLWSAFEEVMVSLKWGTSNFKKTDIFKGQAKTNTFLCWFVGILDRRAFSCIRWHGDFHLQFQQCCV